MTRVAAVGQIGEGRGGALGIARADRIVEAAHGLAGHRFDHLRDGEILEFRLHGRDRAE
jgi:hypothetical protein